MKYIIFALVLTSSLSLDVYSQGRQNRGATGNRPGITGRIIDPNSKPIQYANVSIHNPSDTSLVSGTTSDKNGNFDLKAPIGNYILKVKYLSMKTYYTNVELLRTGNDLGNIKMEISDLILDEVVVEGEKNFIKLELDKRVVNVSANPINRGRSASDILDNIPSVTVDVEGEVSLRGSSNVRILVDGKPSTMIGRDPNQLKQMFGESIDKIEIITNPSARYDAEGEVGIINIVLKKNQNKGFNGNIDLSTSYPESYSVNFNSNYRESFYNLFGSIGANYRTGPGKAFTSQEFYNIELPAFSESKRKHNRKSLGLNTRFGTDIYFNQSNILTSSFYYSFGDRNNSAEIKYLDYFLDKSNYQTTVRNDDENEEASDIEFDLRYRSEFSSKEHYLTFDIKFEEDEDLELSNLSEINLNGFVDDIVQQSSNLEFERTTLFQTDYVHPFNKNGKFELGAKANLRKIDNNYFVEQLEGESWSIIPSYNDNFIYLENIYAAYSMIGDKWGSFSLQGGLRYELSDISTELKGVDYKNQRDYFNFFPSIHTSYEISTGHSVQLSYARRISRPRFRHLMPFYSFTDSRNVYGGNPDLEPEFSDSYETAYLFEGNKSSFLSSFYYRKSEGIIQRIARLDSAGYTTVRPDNIGWRESFGLELNLSYDPIKNLNLNGNANFYHATIFGDSEVQELEGTNLISETNSINAKFSGKYKTPFGFDFQMNYNYRGPQNYPQGEIEGMWTMDMAASMDFLDKNATLTLSGRDIFNTRIRRMTVLDDNFYSYQEFQWRSGAVVLSFNYRINSNRKTRSGRRSDSEDFDY